MNGPAREMTLAECVAHLSADHRARVELAALESQLTTVTAERDQARSSADQARKLTE